MAKVQLQTVEAQSTIPNSNFKREFIMAQSPIFDPDSKEDILAFFSSISTP